MNAWLLALLLGAPRLPFGDVAVGEHASGAPALDPIHAASITDLTIAGAVFEGLYAIDGANQIVPDLASELPRFEPGRALIPLRKDVLRHDGKPLSAADVVRAMSHWASPSSNASYLALPLGGGRAAIAGAGGGTGLLPISVTTLDDGSSALIVPLAQPFPELARLFASERSSLVFGSGKAPPIGSGPFKLEGQRPEGLTLSAFAAHRMGRPYLDRWLLRPGSLARPPPATGATLALDIYAGPTAGPAPARELWFLRVGTKRPELRSARLFRALESAVGRDRLAKRYLAGEARPTETVRGSSDDPQLTFPNGPPTGGIRAILLIPERLAPDRRFAERVQLDLLRAGVTATIETVKDETLATARRSADVELALDCFVFEGDIADDAAHGLFAVMALAAATGGEGVVSEQDLAAFAGEDEPARQRRVAGLDRRLRDEAWIVPIAERSPRARIGTGLAGAVMSPTGAVHLEDAWSARLLPAREE